MMMNVPEQRISVVVLTYQRCAELTRTLRHLQRLPEQPAIIVVDNGASDDTSQLLQQHFPQVKLIRARLNCGAAGRNLGARAAGTRYVAFCDDDTWWQPGCVARAADLLDRYPQVAAITARVLVGPRQREDSTCRAMQRSPLTTVVPLPGKPILGLLAGATAFRTDAFLAAGGYQPHFFLGGEETLLALDLAAAGWALTYVPELTVVHWPSPLRDSGARQRLLSRNAMWTAWLRLPAGVAWRHTVRTMPELWRVAGAAGCWQALCGWRWIWRQRRVLPPSVEAMRRQLEDWQHDTQQIKRPMLYHRH